MPKGFSIDGRTPKGVKVYIGGKQQKNLQDIRLEVSSKGIPMITLRYTLLGHLSMDSEGYMQINLDGDAKPAPDSKFGKLEVGNE